MILDSRSCKKQNHMKTSADAQIDKQFSDVYKSESGMRLKKWDDVHLDAIGALWCT